MSTSTTARAVRFDADNMWIELQDGRTLGIPIAWFPRLLAASPEDRSRLRISPRGLHWEVLDEDISIEALLAGHGAVQSSGSNFAA